MRHLTDFELAAAFLILFLACTIIVAMIALGLKMAADARIEAAEKSVNRRAERIAREIVRQKLDGLQIQVTQHIVVVEEEPESKQGGIQ